MDFLLPEEKIKKHLLPEVNAKAIGTVKDVSLGHEGKMVVCENKDGAPYCVPLVQ